MSNESSLYTDWKLVLSDSVSPDLYIEAGFYFMIGAALQRRVWTGGRDWNALFPNTYMFFIDEPAAGKGEVTTLIKDILSKPKLKRSMEDEILESLKGSVNSSALELIPIGADSTTYESLTEETAKASRAKRVRKLHANDTGIYTHASIVFVLDEVVSLINRDADKINTFLLSTYDAKSTPYKRKTKHQGHDTIVNCCINIIGGSQPDVFSKVASQAILGNGFLSRTFLLHGGGPRCRRMYRPAPTPEQEEAKRRIEDYVLKLTEVYGEVSYEPGVKEFFAKWYEDPEWVKRGIVNRDPRLSHYYARKSVHAQKLVMIRHYSESLTERPIAQHTVDEVIEMLTRWETLMHRCFGLGGRNDLAITARNIVAMLRMEGEEGMTLPELQFEFINDVRNSNELTLLLGDLVRMEKLESFRNGTIEIRYKAKQLL